MKGVEVTILLNKMEDIKFLKTKKTRKIQGAFRNMAFVCYGLYFENTFMYLYIGMHMYTLICKLTMS